MEPLTGERLARSRCTPAVWCVGEPDVCWGSKMSPPTERPTRQVLPRNRPPSRAAVDSALGQQETSHLFLVHLHPPDQSRHCSPSKNQEQ